MHSVCCFYFVNQLSRNQVNIRAIILLLGASFRVKLTKHSAEFQKLIQKSGDKKYAINIGKFSLKSGNSGNLQFCT